MEWLVKCANNLIRILQTNPFHTPISDCLSSIDENASGEKLHHIGEDGAFYIRGVRYNIVPRDKNGFIGSGGFGMVWRAERDPNEPPIPCKSNAAWSYSSQVLNHYADWVFHLLNAKYCCVKLVQVECETMTKYVNREIELHAQAGRCVQGVLAILAATPIPKGKKIGPVTIDPKWIEDSEGSNRLKPKIRQKQNGESGDECDCTHWAVIAVELAGKGNLRNWTSPISKCGDRLRTIGLAAINDEENMNDSLNEPGNKESVFGGTDGSGNEDLARGVMYRLLTSVNELHKLGILHLDIKPENITINDQWDVCLIDFGVALKKDGLQHESGRREGKRAGTPGFRAPESIPDEKTDVFALGMTLCCLLLSSDPIFSQHPYPQMTGIKDYRRYFAGDNPLGFKILAKELQNEFSELVCHPKRPRVKAENISDHAADLCQKMVLEDSTQRFTIEECLKHDWFQGNFVKERGDRWKIFVRQSLNNTGEEGRVFWSQNCAGTQTRNALGVEDKGYEAVSWATTAAIKCLLSVAVCLFARFAYYFLEI